MTEQEKQTFSEETQPADLKKYQWENRLLVLFAPNPGWPEYEGQMAKLTGDAEALEARDLVQIHIFEEVEGYVGDEKFSLAQNEELRKRFDVETGQYAMFLVGKDGGPKERYTEPVEPNDIYSLIDSMPMRQKEMQGNTKEEI